MQRYMKTILVGIAAVVGLLAAGSARAATNPVPCANDIDCVATPGCGGEVCRYAGDHPFTCQPAGTDPKGMDGWCTHDSDCKCHDQGAVCVNATYCTFTLMKDGSARDIKIAQRSGNTIADFAAQRAILDSTPFPPLPPGAGTSTNIEFVFNARR